MLTVLCLLPQLAATAAGQEPAPAVFTVPPAEPLAAPPVPAHDARPRVSDEARLAAAAANAFAVKLYRQLGERARPDENVLFSPLSVWTSLAMTYAGANGRTADEMRAALGLELPPDRLHGAAGELQASLQGTAAPASVELRIANSLWGQGTFLRPFLETLRYDYRAPLRDVDFSATEQVRRQINAWAYDATGGKIDNLLPDGALQADTRLVLANAVYFKGQWAQRFDPQRTKCEADFWITPQRRIAVPMMHQTGTFRYAAHDEGAVRVLELPYVGGSLAMLLLLPGESGGLGELESRLTADAVQRWSSSLRTREVAIGLPRFTITWERELSSALAALGIGAALSPHQADFSGMTGDKDIYLDAVLHKAMAAVNEQGTEAAAASASVAVLAACTPPIDFVVNRPFLFAIRHTDSGALLFLGRVARPDGAPTSFGP